MAHFEVKFEEQNCGFSAGFEEQKCDFSADFGKTLKGDKGDKGETIVSAEIKPAHEETGIRDYIIVGATVTEVK